MCDGGLDISEFQAGGEEAIKSSIAVVSSSSSNELALSAEAQLSLYTHSQSLMILL